MKDSAHDTLANVMVGGPVTLAVERNEKSTANTMSARSPVPPCLSLYERATFI
jgi:hypothetical protein